MQKKAIKSRFVNRVAEIFLPSLTLLIITLPLWLSPFHPALVAYFIIGFDLYFLFKSVSTVYLASLSFQLIKQYSNINFSNKLLRLNKAEDIHHFVIIPNYQEPLSKLESTVKSITNSDYPYKNLYLVLAFEEREEGALKKGGFLNEKYSHRFKDTLICYHPLLKNETAGKASNQTYAAKIMTNYVAKLGLKSEKVLITVCDADSYLPKNYFSYLTYQFLRDKDRLFHFYWAPVLLYNNFWRSPFIIRLQATLSSILRLAFLSNKDNLIQISTYSTSLWLLKKLNFWDVDIIPEDWHIYLQAFFTFGDKIKTIPLYTVVNGDAVCSGKFIKTLINRYEQEKRWAWGVSDIGYALKKLLTSPSVSLWSKIKKLLFLIETHLLWPTSFFILTLSASIPPLINPVFKRTVLGFLLPKLSGLILTLASALILIYVYLDIKLRQRVAIKTKIKELPFLIIQWYFLPLISFLFSSLPALESHTRLLLGKKIKYKVTEKV